MIKASNKQKNKDHKTILRNSSLSVTDFVRKKYFQLKGKPLLVAMFYLQVSEKINPLNWVVCTSIHIFTSNVCTQRKYGTVLHI